MAIVPSGVSVPAQSKELDNNVVTTSYGTVYRQVVNLADPETPTNYQRVGSNGAYVDVRNVVSLPLPSGAATSALQTTGNTSLSTIITNTTGVSTAANQTTGNASLSTIATNTTGLNSLTKNTGIVDANTIRVSPATDVTQAISAVSLPLPSGASTSALQTTGNSSLSSIDGKITAVNTGAVVVSSSALPTGAATESTLSALSAKFSALGQTTMAASVPVVLASNHSNIVTKKSASSYAHLNSTGTTTIKSGAGILRRVVINTKGSASNTFTIYDNTSGSGTVIAAIDTVNGVSGHFEYNVAFSIGLTVVGATGTSADITVIYE